MFFFIGNSVTFTPTRSCVRSMRTCNGQGTQRLKNSQMVGFFSWFGEATKRPRANCGGFFVFIYIYTLIIYTLYINICIHIFFPTLWKVKIDYICFLDQCLMGLEDCIKGLGCNEGITKMQRWCSENPSNCDVIF